MATKRSNEIENRKTPPKNGGSPTPYQLFHFRFSSVRAWRKELSASHRTSVMRMRQMARENREGERVGVITSRATRRLIRISFVNCQQNGGQSTLAWMWVSATALSCCNENGSYNSGNVIRRKGAKSWHWNLDLFCQSLAGWPSRTAVGVM